MKSEILNFRTSSGIKSIVGKDLITDKFVAIFELVKNSYDAKAKNVVVSFNNLEYQDKNDLLNFNNVFPLYELGEKEPYLIIKDDGIGMNKEDLENKWLFLAYSEKKDKEGSINTVNVEGDDKKLRGSIRQVRSFVGSKGVGRFSCDTLGEKLILKTKKANENIEHLLFIDWKKFEENQNIDFDRVNVEYYSNPVNNNSSYTELIIRDLRSPEWSLQEEQELIKRALEKLKNPFKVDDGFNIYTGLNISTEKPPSENKITNNISEIIKGRTITVEALIDNVIEMEIFDRGEPIFKLRQSNDTILSKTPIIISLHVLNQSAKNMFTRRMGMSPLRYGTVFIYKNGFRVMPYGDESIDLFGLNLRKGQGFYRYISTRELLGYFEIQDQNNFFKESSSRNNGFIQNSYFKSLEELYMDKIHRIIERYIQLIQWGENTKTEEEIFFDPNHNELDKFKAYIKSKGYDIIFFKDNIEDEIEKENPEKQLEKIILTTKDSSTKKTAIRAQAQIKALKDTAYKQSKVIKSKEQKEQNLEQQVKNLQLARRDENTFNEQITHHFVGMGDKLRLATDKITPIIRQLDSLTQERVLKELNKIRSVQQELTIFKNLLLKTNLDLRSDQLVNWFEQAEWFMKEKSALTKRIKFSCVSHINTNNFWNITCNIIGLQMMFENFYQNSRDHKASYIDITFYEDRLVIENDTGPISDEDIEKITELGYSTKANGTGIGLHQIAEFIEKYGFKLNIESINTTVKFEIIKEGK